MDKKVVEFDIGDMWPIALAFIVTGIGIAYGLSAMGDVKSSMTVNSAEYNATQSAIEGVAKFPAKFGIIATIVVAAIIIGIIVRYFRA